ncbi:transcriptional regulator domain-containing protein [Bradyrhizobium sp. USDA 4515]
MQIAHHVDPTSFFPAKIQLGIVSPAQLASHQLARRRWRMSEDENWRSESAYDYIDDLTPSELAWEFLRRNPDYRNSYYTLLSSGRLTEETAREFAQQWGLRFRSRPARHGARPADLLDPASRSGRDPARGRSGGVRRLPSHR